MNNTQKQLNYKHIITKAWEEFDDRHAVQRVIDASPKVSTNNVFKVIFNGREPVFAKLSDYGKYDDFREEHIIINNLSNNLEAPYENFLAHPLVKRNEVFIYRYSSDDRNAWVVFYNPIRMKSKLPRRLDERLIYTIGQEAARFHRACSNVSNQLPTSSKNIATDIRNLIHRIDEGKFERPTDERNLIRDHAEIFLEEITKLNYFTDVEKIPVFVDWNIGNFSVRGDGTFYSRWDYDWFRVTSRVLDFYFFSRVVSSIGDRTEFSYVVDTLNEDRFLLFLKTYHSIFPLTEREVRLIKEAYRFFILNYVVKDGYLFFLPKYADKFRVEAYKNYLPSIDTNYNVDVILKALKIKQ